ncbi:MAG: hypothetical protein HC822_02345 [Oscillochloris sp.]|nr:hypothetical protein [Oscillochloris sp.]
MHTDQETLARQLEQRLPEELRIAPPIIQRYEDELLIMLTIAPPETPGDDPLRAAQQQIAVQRESSRKLRMQLAAEIQRAVGLPVAWGMRVGDVEVLFTSRTVPVMTRLNRLERDVLDTLVAAGVADTRSSALAYVVRTFALEHGSWLEEVRGAIAEVSRVRGRLKIRPRRSPPQTSDEP